MSHLSLPCINGYQRLLSIFVHLSSSICVFIFMEVFVCVCMHAYMIFMCVCICIVYICILYIVKAVVFPAVMYGHESWTINEAE